MKTTRIVMTKIYDKSKLPTYEMLKSVNSPAYVTVFLTEGRVDLIDISIEKFLKDLQDVIDNFEVEIEGEYHYLLEDGRTIRDNSFKFGCSPIDDAFELFRRGFKSLINKSPIKDFKDEVLSILDTLTKEGSEEEDYISFSKEVDDYTFIPSEKNYEEFTVDSVYKDGLYHLNKHWVLVEKGKVNLFKIVNDKRVDIITINENELSNSEIYRIIRTVIGFNYKEVEQI